MNAFLQCINKAKRVHMKVKVQAHEPGVQWLGREECGAICLARHAKIWDFVLACHLVDYTYVKTHVGNLPQKWIMSEDSSDTTVWASEETVFAVWGTSDSSPLSLDSWSSCRRFSHALISFSIWYFSLSVVVVFSRFFSCWIFSLSFPITFLLFLLFAPCTWNGQAITLVYNCFAMTGSELLLFWYTGKLEDVARALATITSSHKLIIATQRQQS